MAEKIKKEVNSVARAMKSYYAADQTKVMRSVRVFTLAKTIGELERLPEDTQLTLELASLLFDVASREDSKIPEVKKILSSCEVEEETAMRVCHIVENQNDFDHVSALDHQILIEAVHIVRFKEEATPEKEIIRQAEDIFLTNYGKAFLKKAFNI